MRYYLYELEFLSNLESAQGREIVFHIATCRAPDLGSDL